MAAFEYIALDPNGNKHKGVIEGDSARQVRQQLITQGLTPLQVDAVSKPRSKTEKKSAYRIKATELAVITRQLAALISARLPVEEALLAVAEQIEKQQLKSVMMGVRSQVMNGHSLAKSMAHFERAFPALYRATVDAGEQTGRLDHVLEQLADYTEQQLQLKQKIQQAMIYPSLMVIVSISIVSFLLIYVVPKIIAVFTQSGQALPLMTSILIGISSGLANYGIYLLIVLAIAYFIYRRLLKRPAFRYKIDKLILATPLIGSLVKVINSSRFSRTFSILTRAGVDVLQAMKASAELITNQPIKDAVLRASQQVREGSSISQALKQTQYFPPMSIHLIASGEATGQLEKMLERASDNQDRDINRYIETGLVLFEPILILLMGTVVLFIVLAILLPIFSLDQIAGLS